MRSWINVRESGLMKPKRYIFLTFRFSKLDSNGAPESCRWNRVQHVAISTEAVLVSCELRQAHGDPFYRLLFAQAKVDGLRLLSVDRALLTFGATVVSSKISSRLKAPRK
jgi:PIN domain nuclease of toxin-antitoxin system